MSHGTSQDMACHLLFPCTVPDWDTLRHCRLTMSKNESVMAMKPDFRKQMAFTFVTKVMDFYAVGSVPALGP